MKRSCSPLFLILFLFSFSEFARAQEPPGVKAESDTGKIVNLIHADKFRLVKQDTTGEIYMLVGHVSMRQGKTLLSCDSAIHNKKLNMVESFGNVHINDADSVHTFSQYLRYMGNTRMAYLNNQVRLTDGKGELTTENLEYDLNSKIGSYQQGGKLVNGTTVLTSRQGFYYADTREAWFQDSVRLVNPDYTVASDTLQYNVDSEIATFVAPTTINDGQSVIRTRSGFYDLRNGVASFGDRPVVEDSSQQIVADNIHYDKKTGQGHAEGNVFYRDTAQGVTILAGDTKFESKTSRVLASLNPVMILKQDQDSLFIAADTLLSSSYADTSSAGGGSDSLQLLTKTDTRKVDSIRIFEAYRHVRLFSDSLQGACDSLAYSSRDSVFRMYTNPILWAKESQVTGDTIYLYTKNKKADQIDIFENGFSINRAGDNYFNQIRGNRINGYFHEGDIDYLRAKGNAESVYYLQDEDSAYIGMNYASADAISMYFEKKELKRVTWVNSVEGTTYPMNQIPEERKKLRQFNWQESRRPKTWLELFEN